MQPLLTAIHRRDNNLHLRKAALFFCNTLAAKFAQSRAAIQYDQRIRRASSIFLPGFRLTDTLILYSPEMCCCKLMAHEINIDACQT